MKRFLWVAAVAIVVAAVLYGMDRSGYFSDLLSADSSPPGSGPISVAVGPELFVTEVAPALNAISVDPMSPILITLSDPVDRDSFDPEAFSVFARWSGVAAGEVTLEKGGSRIRFVPEKEFQAGEWVTASLRKGVRTKKGSVMERAYIWDFWIRSGPGSLEMADLGERTLLEEGEKHVQPYGAYAGDFNGDGYSDLAIPNEVSADVRIMINDGKGNYEEFAVLDIPSGNWPSPNEGADFNGDGFIDFAVGNIGNDLVTVFMGDGEGGFKLGANYQAGRAVRGVCILDLNGDGWADMATTNQGDGEDRSTRGSVSILLNDGAGRFADITTIPSPGRGEKTCATGDANGDGLPDLLAGAFNSDEVLLFLGDGKGGLTFTTRTPAGGNPWMIASGDMNGDGHLDVVSANREGSNLAVLLGDGAGNFGEPATFPVGKGPMAVDLGDLDGDGDLDPVSSEYEGNRFTVYENAGGGVLVNPRVLAASSAGSCAVIHDRDRDGDLDITGVDEVDDKIFLFENPGKKEEEEGGSENPGGK